MYGGFVARGVLPVQALEQVNFDLLDSATNGTTYRHTAVLDAAPVGAGAAAPMRLYVSAQQKQSQERR